MSNKRTRGFAAMDPEKQRVIASKGGKAAHAKGTAHRFTTAEASEAGRKGGRAAHARGTAHRFTAAEASEAGRKGGSRRVATTGQHREAGTENTMETQRMEGPAPTGTTMSEQPVGMRAMDAGRQPWSEPSGQALERTTGPWE